MFGNIFITLTFPNRTNFGKFLSSVQCAAVKIKFSEIIVPPQPNLVSFVIAST